MSAVRGHLVQPADPHRQGRAARVAVDVARPARTPARAPLVVQKHLAADSLPRWLRDLGYTCERVGSKAGFRLFDTAHGVRSMVRSMIGLDDIRAAAAVITSEAVVTPVLRSDVLDERVGATIVGKDKSQQRAGSFKFRGAFHRLSLIPAEDRGFGVVAVLIGQSRRGGGVCGGDPGRPGNGPHSRRRRSGQPRAHRTLRRHHRDLRSDDTPDRDSGSARPGRCSPERPSCTRSRTPW